MTKGLSSAWGWGGESEEKERGPLAENRVGDVQGRGDSVPQHVAVTI